MELCHGGSRGDYKEVIVEEFIKFNSENGHYRRLRKKMATPCFARQLDIDRNVGTIKKAGNLVQ